MKDQTYIGETIRESCDDYLQDRGDTLDILPDHAQLLATHEVYKNPPKNLSSKKNVVKIKPMRTTTTIRNLVTETQVDTIKSRLFNTRKKLKLVHI